MAYDRYPAIDENDDLPPAVREALAKSNELRSQVNAMSTADRELLLASDKWDGRVILNTSRDRLERWDGTAWFDVAADLLVDNPRLAAIPAVTTANYDVMDQAGWYAMSGSSANAPTPFACYLDVRVYSSTAVVEQVARISSGATYRRYKISDTWGAWAKTSLDEGTSSIVFASGVANVATRLFRVNGSVHMYIYVRNDNAGAVGNLLTVPVGFKAPSDWRGYIARQDFSFARTLLNSAGVLSVEGGVNGAGYVVYGSMSWPQAEV